MILFQTTGLVVQFFKKSIMSKAYEIPFTAEEKQFLYSKLFKFHELNGCHIWYGATDSDGYAVIRPTFRLKRQIFTVHRLIYYLENDCHFYNRSYHVSHLCHNKKCINIQHLSLEPGEINVRRNSCRQSKTCCGHDGFKNCIFR